MDGLVRDERGRFISTRSLRISSTSEPHVDEPNSTVPPESDPSTVGPLLQVGGDPDGVVIEAGAPAPPNPPAWFHASRWDGWPDAWFPPLFGRLQTLTDTAWAGLDLNSGVLASMPPYLVGASPGLPADWLNNPDPDLYGSWADFARQLFWDFQLGEAFIICTARYANGWPARFHVAPPWTVDVELGPDGNVRYSIGRLPLDPFDVLQIKYQANVGDLHGTGPLAVGNSRMIAANVLARYATNFAASGGIPTSILEHPEELTAKQSADLREQWITARMEALGVPAVMSGGVTLKTIQVDPLQSALVELERFMESRIAVLLQIPPYLLGLPAGGDSLTYTNANSIREHHWQGGLKPKAQRVMLALSQWLTPRGTGIELNRDEYVRPGPLERAQTWEILIRAGVMTPEEARAFERLDQLFPSVESLPSGVFK